MMEGKYGQELETFNDGISDEILADIEMLEENAGMSVVDACGDDLWLDQMVSDFLVEFPNFDILDYLDPELKSSLDNGVTDTLHRIDHEMKQQEITLNSLLSRDEDINELRCRAHCVNQMFEQNQKLITELQNELESLRKIQSNLQISSMGKDLEGENTDVHSKNVELCVEDTPTDRKTPMKGTEEENVGDKIISKEPEDVLPNTDAEHQLQSNNSSDNFSFNDSSKKSASSHFQQRLRRRTDTSYELRNSKSSESKRKTNHGRKARKHNGMGLHYCNVCRRQFISKSILVTHLRTHSGEKRYECKVCQKSFNQSSSLRRHLIIHSGEKPYKCTVCEKALSESSNLRRHLLIHSGEKPYKCTVCQKAFSRSGSLRIHLRIHSGEKPYKCTVCEKAFSESSNLRRHLLIHSGKKTNFKLQVRLGEKPYKCTVCQKVFTQSSHLSSHLRIHFEKRPRSTKRHSTLLATCPFIYEHILIYQLMQEGTAVRTTRDARTQFRQIYESSLSREVLVDK